MKTRAMIVKIKSNSWIVLTPEGEYREVPLREGFRARVGQEIQIPQKKNLPYLRFLMVAASLLVVVLAGQFFPVAPPPAAAYLTIDINPSVELAVTNSAKVVSARGINGDGDRILAEVEVKGVDLRDAVARIVTQAVADRFLCEEEDNIILATLTVEENQEPLVDLGAVYEAIENPVKSGGVNAEIIIEPVEPQMREAAAKTGLSTGRFLLLQKSSKKGVQFNAVELSAVSLGNLEKTKKINIIELMMDDQDASTDGKPAGPGEDKKTKNKQRGIYHEGRMKDHDVVKTPEGKAAEAGAQRYTDSDKKDHPGKNAVKDKEKPKEAPGKPNNKNKGKSSDSNSKKERQELESPGDDSLRQRPWDDS